MSPRQGMAPGLLVLLNSPWILPHRWQHNQGSKGQTSQELNKLKLISREALQGRQSHLMKRKRRLKHGFPGALRKVSWIRIIIPAPIFSRFVIKVPPPTFVRFGTGSKKGESSCNDRQGIICRELPTFQLHPPCDSVRGRASHSSTELELSHLFPGNNYLQSTN